MTMVCGSIMAISCWILSIFPKVLLTPVSIAALTSVSMTFTRARHHVDLSFLLEMPYVRSFQLDCGLADSVDLTPLYHLPRLCSLHICGQVKEVDLSRFPCLTRLECLFQPGVMFSSTTITSLKVAGAPRLDFLSGLPNVTTIQLTYYKGSDVHGVRCASRLRDFTAHSARNLVDVSELQQCAYLRSVDLEGVPPTPELQRVGGNAQIWDHCISMG